MMGRYFTITGHYTGQEWLAELESQDRAFMAMVVNPEQWGGTPESPRYYVPKGKQHKRYDNGAIYHSRSARWALFRARCYIRRWERTYKRREQRRKRVARIAP